ncbi:SDR family oxidoreductase [Gluconacetobacter sacchari]|uniref:SDR family oxidoreductase n=2 Tax=Gluconacetobacter sacchari TaxID=92759 RepID=A0A7W4NT66_9PROT|nr:SDR family oxidoreductase [Gluconacetobacter sacchari]MBB2161985.1 SDR family oxidoreductase [Gluconacetobacter sacchari]GBQ18661.1 dehydrogenase [Gluconacetobacter sacchari DSM 12717]
MDVRDKRVVVLGGTSGIGLAVAEAAAGEGARVAIASSRRASVDTALARLPAGAEGHMLDLRDEAAVRDLFTAIGPFDHLVFTAGESLRLGSLADMSLPSARGFFELRYWGALTAVKYAAPLIRPGGSIVFTSGIAGARPPQPGWALGASICGAMEGLTRALAVELAPIRVNIVVPGFVKTPLWNDIPDALREDMYATAGEKLLVRRIGEPDDLAAAYLFLMKQPFATGQSFVIDGGGMLV